MKILVVNKFWREAGGVEQHMFDVVRWLESRGHEVVPFAMQESDTNDSPYSERFPGEVDFRAGKWSERIAGLERASVSSDTTRALRRLLTDMQIDAAYVLHVYHQLGTVILNELDKAGVPTVLSLHDYKVACPNYRLYSERTGKICTKCVDLPIGSLWAPAVERCWGGSVGAGVGLSIESLFTRMRKSYSKPAVVMTLNSLQEQVFVKSGISASSLMRVAHPVEVRGTNRSLVSGEARFIFVGRLVPEKGVKYLIEAAAIERQAVDIIGDGRDRPSLERLAKRLDAPVTFHGSVPHQEVSDRLAGARALIVPSVWHEVSPLVVLEAISADVPVIATELGGMVDQLDGGRGFLVPPRDANALAAAMRAVWENPQGAQARSALAREHAAEYLTKARWEATMASAFERAGVVV